MTQEAKLRTVLLLQEHDGSWVAMCRADAKMREVRGATIEQAQAALRHQWTNPVPLRFPEDFPLMDHEFDAMQRHAVGLMQTEDFDWYVLNMEARKRNLAAALDEGLKSGPFIEDGDGMMDRITSKLGIPRTTRGASRKGGKR